MRDRSESNTSPAPWRALSVAVFIVAGLVAIPMGIYAATTREPVVLYLLMVFAGLCSIANGVRIARELLRERAQRA